MRKLGVLPIMYVGNRMVENMECLFDGERRGDICGKQGYSGIYQETLFGTIHLPACQKHWDEAMIKLYEEKSN